MGSRDEELTADMWHEHFRSQTCAFLDVHVRQKLRNTDDKSVLAIEWNSDEQAQDLNVPGQNEGHTRYLVSKRLG